MFICSQSKPLNTQSSRSSLMLLQAHEMVSKFLAIRQPAPKSCTCWRITLRDWSRNLMYMCILFLLDYFLIISQGIQGEVSLTCDAWQASNADGYFAVTAHWIDDSMTGKWELKSALIGFTQLNNAHNGEWLGQALFKIIRWVGIEHKVSISSQSIIHWNA